MFSPFWKADVELNSVLEPVSVLIKALLPFFSLDVASGQTSDNSWIRKPVDWTEAFLVLIGEEVSPEWAEHILF